MASHNSPHEAPEAVHDQTRGSGFGFVGSDSYEYYEPPPAGFERQRSPVPEYQQYETSPRISAQSPPPPSSDIGRSPQISENGTYSKSRPLSPSVQYSEIHSPDPERAYDNVDKEAVYTDRPESKVPSYYAAPVPGHINHQNSNDRPQVWADQPQHNNEKVQKKRPVWKKWWFWLILLLLIIAIAVGVGCGVALGTKKSNKPAPPAATNGTTPTNTTTPDNPNVDIQTSIGGQINNAYYSEFGAWNGSGIAIAAADSTTDQSIYAFYQDAAGTIQYTLMNPQYQWSVIGPVNSGSYKALNGTPLSTVKHTIGDQQVWHLFYIDTTYTLRERIITNVTTNGPAPVWTDGPLNAKNLKTWNSNTIGLQACYWGNYYGDWSYGDNVVSAGIHLWFASDSTTFQQYDWTNGTQDWVFNQQWPSLSGNGGVGCQTWDSGMTEYVWFVDTQGSIAMSWRDNNRTANATTDHPIGSWTPVDIGVTGVQKDSSLGYTNYMVWQADDTTIRGASVLFGAEKTALNKTAAGVEDSWTLQNNGKDIQAVRGTHLSITALTTASKGANLLTFFQEEGDDVAMYTRDAYNPGGLWSAAPQDPVVPESA